MVDMDLTNEIIVFVLLVVATIMSFFGIFCMFFPLRKNLMEFYKVMSLFPNDRWKEIRNYIIPMNMMSFVFGMLICSIIVFIYEGGL
jgi:hypothetical protein